MKFAAWCLCWPLLGIFGALAFVTDFMGDACDWLDGVLGRLEDYMDAPRSTIRLIPRALRSAEWLRRITYGPGRAPNTRHAMYEAISAYLNACARCAWLMMLALDDASEAFAQK